MVTSTREYLANNFPSLPSRKLPKVVAVTGAGRGIGRALSLRLAAEGFEVVALSRKLPHFEHASSITSFQIDVSDADQCHTVFEEVARTVGPIDAMVANAAIYEKSWFLDQSAQSFAAHLRINVEGVANSIRMVLPKMLERNLGRLVVLGSLAGSNPAPGSIAYSVSKNAIHALVKGIDAEIDHSLYPNVLINEFNPGPTKTQMSEHGSDPATIADHIISLIRATEGSASGRMFLKGREIHPHESWRRTVRRLILRH